MMSGEVVQNYSFNPLDFPPPGGYNGLAGFLCLGFGQERSGQAPDDTISIKHRHGKRGCMSCSTIFQKPNQASG
jgi:hypothetical protein